ncbi:hypothetical protein NDU88_002770 [Pleurodeles waltl]|uniref:Uncharacterized protein n=1 Tax=Pleurodeles waltl TaxID=8319 RepID=A0AAV7NI08_PLEWA|nr:hypothetical protein NDU88_002770 [Pleurodeles waltl]
MRVRCALTRSPPPFYFKQPWEEKLSYVDFFAGLESVRAPLQSSCSSMRPLTAGAGFRRRSVVLSGPGPVCLPGALL